MSLHKTDFGKLLLMRMEEFQREHLINPEGQLILYRNSGSLFQKNTEIHVVDPTPVNLAPGQDPLYVKLSVSSGGSPIENFTSAMDSDSFVIKALTEVYSLENINIFFHLCHNVPEQKKQAFFAAQPQTSTELFLVEKDNEFQQFVSQYRQ